jgi:predicted alpha/beta-fold hydrolase
MDASTIERHPFVPRRGLRGGHLQTLAGNFLKRENRLPKPEERLFLVEPEVQVLCHCHWQRERQSVLTLMIVHGLEGSSNSQYVLGTGAKAWDRGWNVVRMNVRNCGGTEELTPTLYHSGLSGDIRGVANSLVEQDRLQHFALAGFSMGGNQVLKCVGEWGTNAPPQFVAACGVSPACDLSLSADALHRGQNRIYEWWFLVGLFKRFRKKSALFPGQFDPALLKRVRSIRDFDEHITARYMGFAGAEDYYSKASSANVVDKIAVPTLVLHSLDDPFIVMSPATAAKLRANPNITLVETHHGGHCAFLANPDGDDGRWAERQIVEFCAEQLSKRTKA